MTTKEFQEGMQADLYNWIMGNWDKHSEAIDKKIQKIEKETGIKFLKINGRRTLIPDEG